MKQLDPFEVRVMRVHNDPNEWEYNYFTIYHISAPNYHDAEKEAKERFVKDYGAPKQHLETFTFNKQYGK
jgi:hypothetical protein